MSGKRNKFTGKASAPEPATKKKKSSQQTEDCGSLGEHSHVNIVQMSAMQSVLDQMTADPFFEDLASKSPLGTADGASMAAFCSDSLKAARQAHTGTPDTFEFRCTGNFMWQNPQVTLNPSVRIMPSSVAKLKNFHYSEEKQGSCFKIAHEIVIGIPLEDKKYDVSKHLGALPRITPIEYIHAPLGRIGEKLGDPKVTDNDKRAIVKALLSCVFVFKLVHSSKMKYQSMQARENVTVDAEAVNWTTLQRIQLVVTERESMMTMSDNGKFPSSIAVAKNLIANVDVAPRNEKFTDSYVDTACTVAMRILADATSYGYLMVLDDSYGENNPLNRITALQYLADKIGKSQTKLRWVLASLIDDLAMINFKVTDLNVSKVKKSYFPQTLLRFDLREWGIHKFMEVNYFKLDDKLQIIKAMESHDSVRKFVQPLKDQPQIDVTWMSNLSEAARCWMNFFYELVFGNEYAPTMSTALHWHKGFDEFLEYQTIAEEVKNIVEMSKKENSERNADNAGGKVLVDPVLEPPAGADDTSDVDVPDAFEDYKKKTKTLDSDVDWKGKASKAVREIVRIVPWPDTCKGIQEEVQNNPGAMDSGDATGVFLLFVDVKQRGESVTAPRTRCCPLQCKPYEMQMAAILSARNKSGDEKSKPLLNAAELAVILDGGKDGNKRNLLKPFKPASADDDDEDGEDDDEVGGFSVRTVAVHKSEASLRKHRNARTIASIPQNERQYNISMSAMSLPEREWGIEGLPGTNKGTNLGPLHQTSPENEWKATVKQKRLIYGKKNRIEVGGQTEGGVVRRVDADIEAVFLKSMPRMYFQALLKGYFVKRVLDCNVGNGAFAEACVEERIGYFGFALTEVHANKLMERLTLYMLHLMCTPKSRHYNVKCAEAFDKKTTDDPDEGKPGGKPKAKAKGKAASKKKPKAKAKPKTKPGADDLDGGAISDLGGSDDPEGGPGDDEGSD